MSDKTRYFYGAKVSVLSPPFAIVEGNYADMPNFLDPRKDMLPLTGARTVVHPRIHVFHHPDRVEEVRVAFDEFLEKELGGLLDDLSDSITAQSQVSIRLRRDVAEVTDSYKTITNAYTNQRIRNEKLRKLSFWQKLVFLFNNTLPEDVG